MTPLRVNINILRASYDYGIRTGYLFLRQMKFLSSYSWHTPPLTRDAR
jgi:hypothetical protein